MPAQNPKPSANAEREFRAAYANMLAAARRWRRAVERELQVESLPIAEAEREAMEGVVMIQQLVADFFHVPVGLLLSRHRAHHLVQPRLIAMVLCAEFTQYSDSAIARAFDRDHGMMDYSRKTVTALRETDRLFAAQFDGCRKAVIEGMLKEPAA